MSHPLCHLLIPAAVLLTSCSTLVGPHHTAPRIDLPAQWNSTGNATSGEGISRTWWKAFGDAELNRLETLALTTSPDMAHAMARVDEARASLREVTAARYPILTGSGSSTRSLQSANAQQIPDFQPEEAATHNLQADLKYELDLWGKIRRNIEASTASTDAVILNGQAVRLRLTAQVAENYFTLRGLEAEVRILLDTVMLRQASVIITTERQKGGQTSEVDVSRAQTEFANTKAELTDLQRRRQLSLHALAALCGQPVTGFTVKTHRHRTPSFAPRTPAILLRQRPDIAEAERTVAERSAEIGAAEAERLPSITLNGSVGLESLSLSDLVSSGSKKFSFGPQIDMPIFNVGALKARSAQAGARHRQAVAEYRNTVITALKEVEDALINTQGYADLSTDYAAAVAAAEQAAKLSKERYDQGSANYLEVTDAQRDVLTSQRRLVQSRNQQTLAAVQLAKALGGGGME
jgi:NodT family efflux transporter outer membrane factor (OMF) lipoprotein